MKYIYQILSYIAVIIITLIIVNNIRFAKDIDHKNELKRLHQQNDSLQANIESNKVLINSLSFEIDSFKTKIEENKKEFASSYTEALSNEYLSAYLKGLKAKASVSVNQKFFETTQKN